MLLIYSLTILLSAALLFSMQPLIGRMVLPLLGGSPSVWNTCMLFFQSMLLAGYGYAHFTSRRFDVRSQAVVHTLIVLAAIAVLPIGLPAETTPPESSSPVVWLMSVLALGTGLPFFVLAATAPLLQRWFAASRHNLSSDPYFLYAASNLGSMLSLLAYPFLIEPRFGLMQQAHAWSIGYVAMVVLMGSCAFIAVRQFQAMPNAASLPTETKITQQCGTDTVIAVTGDRDAASHPSTWSQRLMWMTLAFIPSSWMLGVTSFLSTDIAPIPLFWVMPLWLYLLTFILTFARRPPLRHAWMLRGLAFSLLLLTASLLFLGTWQILLLHLIVFFLGGMVCHGELASRRPHASHLTEFYLWISIGGMLGGALHTFGPLVFPLLIEYPLTIGAGCLVLRSFRFATEQAASSANEVGFGRRRIAGVVLTLAAMICAVGGMRTTMDFSGSDLMIYSVLAAIPVLFLLYLFDRPRPFGVIVSLLLLIGAFQVSFAKDVLHTERSFFGMHRVILDPDGHHRLLHGRTSHGIQSIMTGQCTPRAYYYPSGPLGDVFREFNARGRVSPVGVVGLGTGAAICYQQAGQPFAFFEIDPSVRRIAETPQYFTYLTDCAQSDYRIVLGDGRVRLQSEPAGQFGLLIFDAFSSDAIPVHLLTREAVRMYREKLTADGIMAFHISNSHLDLEPVLSALARDGGLACRVCRDVVVDQNESVRGKLGSTWAVLAASDVSLGTLAGNPRWFAPADRIDTPVWTDDFSNLFEILKWRLSDK